MTILIEIRDECDAVIVCMAKKPCYIHVAFVVFRAALSSPKTEPSVTYEHVITFLPLSHVAGFSLIIGDVLSNGKTLVLMSQFDLEVYLRCIEKYKVNLFFLSFPCMHVNSVPRHGVGCEFRLGIVVLHWHVLL